MDWMSAPNPYSGLGSVSGGIPELVQLSDIPTPGPSSVFLGVGSKGAVSVDLDAESPHILVNAPTGAGKSAVARSVAAQRLSVGDLVVVLDVKMHSHRWVRGLEPVAHYADTPALVGASLVNLGYELHRRNRVVAEWQGPVETAPVGPRVIVLFEETNASLESLKQLDRQVGEGGYKAMQAFRDVVFMGRAVQIHLIAFAQLASHRSGLTADIIENFGTKVLIEPSEKAWKWLVPECGRYRPAQEVKGRAMVCRGSRAREVQLTWMDELSSREHVLSALPAQRRARELSGGRDYLLPPVWRTAIES